MQRLIVLTLFLAVLGYGQIGNGPGPQFPIIPSAGGSANVATTANVLKGDNSGGAVAAVAGTDFLAPAAIDSTVQAFDPDLAALAALASTAGLLKRTGTGAFALGVAGTDFIAPAAIGVDVQGFDADLSAIAGLASTAGMVARTGAGAFGVRTLPGFTDTGTTYEGDGSKYAELSDTNTWTGHQIFAPSTTQTLVAGTAILCNRAAVGITAASTITSTAAPTIADGTEGQTCTLTNQGSNAITLQTEATLDDSNLILGASTVAIAPGQSMTLRYINGNWGQEVIPVVTPTPETRVAAWTQTTAQSVTATTTFGNVFTHTFTAGFLAAGDHVRLSFIMTHEGGANVTLDNQARFEVLFGGVTAVSEAAQTAASDTGSRVDVDMWILGTSSQLAMSYVRRLGGTSGVTSNDYDAALAVDVTASQDLVIRIRPSNSATDDVATLRVVSLEVLR